MLKKSEWIFAWGLYLKSKTKINIIFYQNDVALVYVNMIKYLWNIYGIYLSIDFLFVIIKSYGFIKGDWWF